MPYKSDYNNRSPMFDVSKNRIYHNIDINGNPVDEIYDNKGKNIYLPPGDIHYFGTDTSGTNYNKYVKMLNGNQSRPKTINTRDISNNLGLFNPNLLPHERVQQMMQNRNNIRNSSQIMKSNNFIPREYSNPLETGVVSTVATDNSIAFLKTNGSVTSYGGIDSGGGIVRSVDNVSIRSFNKVIIFRGQNLTGEYQILETGQSYNAGQGQILIGNDQTRSIYVPDGLQVTLYPNFSFSGTPVTITTTKMELQTVGMDYDVSSITVTLNSNNNLFISENPNYYISFVSKYNTDGICQWIAKQESEQSVGYANRCDTSNNIFAGGRNFIGSYSIDINLYNSTDTIFASIDSSNFSTGTYPGFTTKYNTNGLVQWYNYYFSLGYVTDTLDIITDASNNCYSTGYFNGTTIEYYDSSYNQTSVFNSGVANNTNGFLVKYDSSGNLKCRTHSNRLLPYGVTIDKNNNLYQKNYGHNGYGLTYTLYDSNDNSSTYNLANNTYSTIIVKYDISLNPVWNLSIDSSGNGSWGALSDGYGEIKCDNSNNILVGGRFNSNTIFFYDISNNNQSLDYEGGGDNGFIVKYSPSGQVLWKTKIFSSVGGIIPRGLTTDSQNNVYSSGYAYYSTQEITFKNSNNSIGLTLDVTGASSDNGYVCKYNSSGFCQWALKILSPTGTVYPMNISIKNNYIYVIGYFSTDIVFYSSSNTFANSLNSDPINIPNSFLVKYDISGNHIWSTHQTGYILSYGVDVDNDNNPIISGFKLAGYGDSIFLTEGQSPSGPSGTTGPSGPSGPSGPTGSTVIEKLSSGVKNIYATINSFIAIKEDGSVVVWGLYNDPTQQQNIFDNIKDVEYVYTNRNDYVLIDKNDTGIIWDISGGKFSRIAKVAGINANDDSFAILRKDGTVYNWNPSSGFVKVKNLNNIKSIQATLNYYSAIDLSGDVYTWQFQPNSNTVTYLDSLSNITNIYSSDSLFLAKDISNNVHLWSDNQLGDDLTDISGVTNIHTSVSNIDGFALLQKTTGRVFYVDISNVNVGDYMDIGINNIKEIIPSKNGFCAIRRDEKLFYFGKLDGTSFTIGNKLGKKIKKVSAATNEFATINNINKLNSESTGLNIDAGEVGKQRAYNLFSNSYGFATFVKPTPTQPSQNFVPTDIFGINLWLDGSDTATMYDSTSGGSNVVYGGAVNRWEDKSGQNNHAVTLSSPPQLSESYYIGKPLLNFQYNTMTTSFSSYPANCFVVVQIENLNEHNDIIGIGPPDSDNFNALVFSEYTASTWHNGSTGFARTPSCVASSPEDSQKFLLMEWCIEDNNYYIKRNGITIASTNEYTYTPSNNNVFTIGTRYTSASNGRLNSYLAEVIYYNNVIGSTDRTKIEGYLAWKWGISSDLPNDHPYKSAPLYNSPTFTFSPDNIPNLLLWLDAESPDSCMNNGVFSYWYNKAPQTLYDYYARGNGVLTQITNGNNQNLYNVPLGSYFLSTLPTSITNDKITAFMVGSLSSDSTVYARFLGMSSAEGVNDFNQNDSAFMFVRNNGLQSIIVGRAGQYLGYSIPNYDTLFLATAGHNNSIESISVNGDTPNYLNTNISDNFNISVCGIGTNPNTADSTRLVGTIGEILVYNEVLSSDDIAKVEGYLAWKWFLEGNLPVNHPYKNNPPFSVSTRNVGLLARKMEDTNKITPEIKIKYSNVIENKLNVVVAISNPCLYQRRYQLIREFIDRMKNNTMVNLYIVELAYKNQPFVITSSNNINHLQLRVDTLLWHKENMLNLAIEKLLPNNWKSVAWIDGDIEFVDENWAQKVLKSLNGTYDFIQPWSECNFLDISGNILEKQTSFSFNFVNHNKDDPKKPQGHPGYAWACNRKAYDKIGKLYEVSILGSGDTIMAKSFTNNAVEINPKISLGYKETIKQFEKKTKGLKMGCIEGTIKHFYHGTIQNRQYLSRWNILTDSNFDPQQHITRNSNGILVPTSSCPQDIITKIESYFMDRKEDN